MTDDEKLMLLRLQLYTAAQTLKGQEAKDFWNLIEELHQAKKVMEPKE